MSCACDLSYQLELKEDYNKRAEQLTMSEKLNKGKSLNKSSCVQCLRQHSDHVSPSFPFLEESIRLQHNSAAMKAKLEEYNKACTDTKRLQVKAMKCSRYLISCTMHGLKESP